MVFSFSKKKCEECADFLKSEDLNSAKEKSQVGAMALRRHSCGSHSVRPCAEECACAWPWWW